MTYVPEWLRRLVRERAHGRCEYCLIHEDDVIYGHEIDHIIAEKHGGPTTADNLAWACYLCNHFKGSDISSIDQQTGKLTALFNLRAQHWSRHFRLSGNGHIDPLTTAGRVTATLLQFNTESNIANRLNLIALGQYPAK